MRRRTMRRRARRSAWSIFLLLTAFPAAAQPSRPEVEIEPAVTTVGSPVTARLTVTWDGPPSRSAPRFPDWSAGWGEAEVRHADSAEMVDLDGGRRLYRQTVEVVAFRPGTIELPAVVVEIELSDDGEPVIQRLESAPVSFLVRSLLAEEGGEPVPRPPAALESPTRGPAFAWTSALLGAACLVAGTMLLRRRGKLPGPGTTRAKLPPIDELVDRLAALDAEDCAAAHVGLSHALRAYLGRRLGLPLLESTTRDIGQRLAGHLPPKLANNLVELLAACDSVKFARRQVTTKLTGSRLERGNELAREAEASISRAEEIQKAEEAQVVEVAA